MTPQPHTNIQRRARETLENGTSSKTQYAHGAIVRIRLENFVTYDSLEFRPGPNLNVIIGPNGTGKSTIVCAICLGMTGKPAVLGRASNICDFVKYGKNNATIEIELNNTGGRNYVIRRVIYKDNKSDWFINDKSAKIKEVEELVNDLNIQVANLCQFLPQEKVAEFARMNPQELLENTEKAVGGLELYDKHIMLKDRSKMTRDLERDLRTAKENLSKEEAINNRMEPQVKSYLEKRKFEQNIIWLKRKKSCLLYKEKRENYEKVKKDRDRFAVQMDELVKRFQPMTEQKKDLEFQLQKQKESVRAKNAQIQDCQKSNKDLKIKLDDCNEKIQEIVTDFKNKEGEFKNHKTKLKELESSIEALKAQYDEAKGELDEIKAMEDGLKEKDVALRQDHEKASTKEFEIKQEFAKLRNELEECHRRLNELKNVREEKLSKLRERVKDVYAAVQWLDKNKQNFKGAFYEPMFLLMNIKDKRFVKYVENSIAFRDLTSMFLFENSNDMHFFLSEVRDRLSLTVNAALIPQHQLSEFMPPKEIKDIKKYGFQTYLREIIDAPEPILVYLCMYSNIHQVPIGNQDTQKNISSILPNIGEFGRIYTSTHQYTFSKSRYTNKVSSSSSEVPESYWLTSSVNQTQLSEFERNEKDIKQRMKQLEQSLHAQGEEKQKIEKKIEAIRGEANRLREKRAHIDGIGKKLASKKSLLKSLEQQNVNMVVEARARLEKTSELAKKKSKCFVSYLEAARSQTLLNKDRITLIYQEAQLENELSKIENEAREYQQRKSEVEASIEAATFAVREARDEAKYALDAASKVNGVPLDRGVPDSHKQEFAKLPETLEAIEAEIHQAEAISQCAADVDDQVVEEYKQRQETIEQMKKRCEKMESKLNDHQSNYESLKNEWLEKVTSMLAEINTKFSQLFMQLKCAGEVHLSRPDNAEEFNKYGISIRVSFRAEEQLQELTAWQQSGGEKSVSTMLYMIALQAMTQCPFRVVDEINQGMDPVNERKVFEIIVQNSCSRQQAQYFLLTPKLLPDLKFDDKANVICVFNGPYNLPHSNYNLKKFIELRKRINENAD